VHFQTNETPYLFDIYPSAGVGDNQVHFYGVHKILNLGDGLRDMGDIAGLVIGQDFCSRFDFFSEPFGNSWGINNLTCVQSAMQEAGKYNISARFFPLGNSQVINLRRSSPVASDNYHFTVLPNVKSVSVHSGS